MPYMLGILRTKDFDEWKSGFTAEESIAWRKQDGGGSYQIFQAAGDPNTAVVLIEWDNPENARKHAESAKLRGVHDDLLVAPPEMFFVEEVEKKSV